MQLEDQAATLKQLLQQHIDVSGRLISLEGRLAAGLDLGSSTSPPVDASHATSPSVPKQKNAPVSLSGSWFHWYTAQPWLIVKRNRQKFHEQKCLVAFMRLFSSCATISDWTAIRDARNERQVVRYYEEIDVTYS